MTNAICMLFLRHLILTGIILCTLLSPPFQSVSFAIEQKITIINKAESDPPWKQRWDTARDLLQQGRFNEAVELYHKVIEEKPHIEEVRWELGKTYLGSGSYSEALVLIEELIEAAPDKIEYLVSGAEAALALGRADQAARLFGRALAIEPDGALSMRAITGMIDSLKAQQKFSLAIPLMEQLYRSGERSQELLTELARYFASSGKARRSTHFYDELLKKFQVQADMLLEAAEAFDRAGRFDEAAQQREAALNREPFHLEARIELANYYQRQGEARKALPHLLEIIDLHYRPERYLLDVADIYLNTLGRADRALYYYEQYQSEYPDGVDVSEKISALQLLVAEDLMAIVENDGLSLLWRDLGQVTTDRIGIFRAMADMLESQGRAKQQELLEVLKIIDEHDPGDFNVVSRISRIYRQNGAYDTCLRFLDGIEKSFSDRAPVLLLRSRCEAGAGLELEELQSYVSYLQIKPDDQQVRRRSIVLAGSLGLVEKMRGLYEGRGDFPISPDDAFEKPFIHGLLLNGLTDEAHRFLDSVSNADTDAQLQLYIYKDIADTYLNQNRIFTSEQVLRKFAAYHPRNPDSYLALADNFLDRNDAANARLWLRPLLQDESGKQLSLEAEGLSAAQRSRLFYLQLRLDEMAGMKGVVKQAIDYLATRLEKNSLEAADRETLLYAARNLLRDNRYDECMKLLKTFRSRFDNEEQIESLLFICRRSQDGTLKADQPVIGQLSLGSVFEVVDQLIDLGQLEAAHIFISELSDRLPESTRAAVYRARVELLTSRFEAAFDTYTGLVAAYPEESWFREQLLRTQILQGQPESIFSIFSVAADDTGRKSKIDHHLESMNYPRAKLMWARALWSEDRWEEALDVYGLIDTELKRAVDQLLTVIQERPELLEQAPKKDTEADIVATIMSPKFVSENLSNPINAISADYYDAYRWSIIVEKEVAAKSAFKAREFYQAEIEYQELFEEEKTAVEENYPDLATVYGRLGRYKDESELIETIQERSIFYPGLAEASEKSVRRQRPHISFDGGYREEDGRDGFKDITEKYAGLGIQIKPTLYQEVGLGAGRSEYGNNSASTLAKSNRISSTYAIELSDNFQGDFRLGFEDFDTDGKSFLLYDATLFAVLEQKVELYASVRQNPVDDTITSLLDGIYRRDLKFGMTLDYLFGMFFGVDLGFHDYNDDNEGQEYRLWASYRWFGDRSSFDFNYRYLKIQNDISNEPSSVLEHTGTTSTPAYWSPGDYWKHQLSAEYKLELWPTGRLQSGTSWFSAKYALGYEDNDNLVHELEANIFLEIGRPFLVKGSFSTIISDDYDSLEGYISLAYRW